MGTGFPEKLKYKEDPVRAELWLLVIIFSLSTLPFSAEICLFLLHFDYLLYFSLIQLALSTLRASLLFIPRILHSSRHKEYNP